MHPDEIQLVECVRAGRAIVVAGTGISVAASLDPGSGRPHPNASWGGLLEDGLTWLRQHALIDEGVAEAHLTLIRRTPQTHNFISAAEQIVQGMGGATSPHFAAWLNRTVGTIAACDRTLLDGLAALRALGNLLATTNYDGLLLEGNTRLAPVTWRDTDELVGALRSRDADKVIFLHGYWRRPDTVILDWKSYNGITRDERYRDDLAAFWKTNLWVYVGCGMHGLGDPDFGLLLERYGRRARQAGHWDYCLVLDHQKQEFQAHFDAMGFNIRAVAIGDSHARLPGYLRTLLPPPVLAVAPPAVAATPASSAAAARSARLRVDYIKAVQRDVDNRLSASIHNARFIDLGIEDDPSLIRLAWGYHNPETRRSYQSVWEAFQGCDGRLLLLGAPGAGKTTALLQLARQLAQRAADPLVDGPAPFLLNLSKFRLDRGGRGGLWPAKRESIAGATPESAEVEMDRRLEDWVVAEMASFPGLRREQAREWLQEGRVALLLDGLDEFNDDRRADLVRLLNDSLLRQHPNLAVVVCSRTNEYLALSSGEGPRLQLRDAIQLQPLGEQQVADYLQAARAGALLQALPDDAALRELAKTPLTLSMLVLAYGGVAPDDLPSAGSLSETRHHLFERYVLRMLQRRERRKRGIPFDDARVNDVADKCYSHHPDAVHRYLGWLGLALSVRMRTSFSVDRLHSTLHAGAVEARQPFDFAAVYAALGVLLALLLGLVALIILPPTWASAGVALAGATACVAALPLLAAGRREWAIGVGALVVAIPAVTLLTAMLLAQLIAGILPGGMSPLPISLLLVFAAITALWLIVNTGRMDRADGTLIAGLVVAVVIAFGLQGLAIAARLPLFGTPWWQVGTTLLVLALTLWKLAAEHRKTLAALILAAGTVFVAVAWAWNPLPTPVHVLAALGGSGALVLALADLHVALAIVLVGMLCASGGGLVAEAAGSLWAASGFGVCTLVALIRQRWRPSISRSLVRARLRWQTFRLGAAADALANVLDRAILSPVVWRLAALGWRFPWRRRTFLRTGRDAFLLKQSGAEWEFTHRLLRDYFALRQLQPRLQNADPTARLDAIRALGYQGEAALDALDEFSSDADPAVRAAAVEGISHIASPLVTAYFKRLANDLHPVVRGALISSYKRLPSGEQDEFLGELQPLGDGCEVEPLFEASAGDTYLDHAETELFRRLGRQAVQPLRSHLRSRQARHRVRAVEVLAIFVPRLDRDLLAGLDPAKPIDRARIAQSAARLRMPQSAVLDRYRALAHEFELTIKP